MTFQLFSSNFCHILDGYFSWQPQYLVRLEGENCCSPHCNDGSYVKRMNDENHFSWQAQYLVTL